MNIIAYGSLMNIDSLEKTLGRNSILNKLLLPSFRRIFNAPFGDYSFLNIQPSSQDTIEVLYFVLKKNELKKFNKREEGSELIEVLPNFFAFVWPNKNCKELPVLQSYIDVCEEGANKNKINFWKGMKIPLIINDDRSDPKY